MATLPVLLFTGIGGWPSSPMPHSPAARPAATYTLKRPPQASFTWSPERPRVGQPILFASTSTAGTSPIRSYAWDLSGNGSLGQFEANGQTLRTAFSTPGEHVVRLRVRAEDGTSDIAAATVHMGAPPRTVLSPFPVIRIVGTLTRSGVRLRLLTVKAPSRSAITVSCRPRRLCHIATASAVAKRRAIRFHSFERLIPARTRIEIRVTKPGLIGAYTSFLVRRHRLPVRHDSCLNRAGRRPIPCPP